MQNPKEIITQRSGAIYKVPFYKITSEGLTDDERSLIPFHFVKGDKSDESVFRQSGFLPETLLVILRTYFEDVNIGDLKCEETSTAIIHINAALQCLQVRAEKRKAAGVQGTYQPTPKPSGDDEPQAGYGPVIGEPI